MAECKDNTDVWSDSDEGSLDGGGDGKGNNSGRWTKEEHDTFLLGLGLYGRDWKKVATAIKTRTPSQIRSHAQKYFQKLSKSPMAHDGPAPSLGEEDKDAFTVLEYLETTLKSLKRRRDELDCTSSKNSSLLIRETDTKLRKQIKDEKEEESDTIMISNPIHNINEHNDNVDNNNNNNSNHNDDQEKDNSLDYTSGSTTTSERNDESEISSKKSSASISDSQPRSDTKLSRLHEEELIAVQALCGGSHNTNSKKQFEDPESSTGHTSNADSESEGNNQELTNSLEKEQETESETMGSGSASE